MIKPPQLLPGDTVATISLSWGGPGTYPHRYEAGKRQLQEAFGVQVVETHYALRDADWLYRNPQARAEDFNEAFADPSIQGIISTIGGEESIRLLPYIDLDIISANPKVFMGYSDTTISHFACLRAGVVSFYGPAIMAGFGENGGLLPYMEESVRRTLFQAEPIGLVQPNTAGWTVEMLSWATPALQNQRRTLQPSTGWRWLQGRGVARGPLIGGCIEVLDWLRGTAFWPSPETWHNALLFLETSEEAPSPEAVQRMVRCLAAVGVLEQAGAILFGRPGGNISAEQHVAYDAMLRQTVANEYGLADLPIITNMDFGHTDPIMVLPYGVEAEIECNQQTFRILESATTPR